MSEVSEIANKERKFLSPEEAEAMLPDGEYIHTFVNPNGMILGADWEREKILEAFKESKIELSGKVATSMNHGIAMHYNGRFVYVETEKKIK